MIGGVCTVKLHISQQQPVTVARIHLNFELMVRLSLLESVAPLGLVYRTGGSVHTWWEKWVSFFFLAVLVREFPKVNILTEPLGKVS